MSDKEKKCTYKLRVNINGFKFSDIRVALETTPKLRVKIVASEKTTNSSEKNQSEESTKQYVKYYDITSKSNVLPNTMRHYSDPTNPLYLIIEFDSNCEENVFVNLDDSCESLVEMAAKSLLNIKDIETLRHSINNPSAVNPNTNQSLSEVFSTSIIKDLNSATTTSMTPFKKIRNSNGEKLVKIDVNIPAKVTSASIAENHANSILKENKYDILDMCDESVQKNHLFIRFDGLNLFLEANTTHENTTSFFSKQIKVPKGSITKELVFNLDCTRHIIRLEMPFYGL